MVIEIHGRLHRRSRSGVGRSLAAVLATGMLAGTAGLARADGAALYQKNCAGCHGATGKADTPMAPILKVPALAGTKLSAEEIAKHVREDTKQHSAQSQALNDEELAQVAAAVKAL